MYQQHLPHPTLHQILHITMAMTCCTVLVKMAPCSNCSGCLRRTAGLSQQKYRHGMVTHKSIAAAKHDIHDFQRTPMVPWNFLLGDIGRCHSAVVVSAEGHMNAPMTHQPLKCNQGIHCLNFFNAADVHKILRIRSKTDFTHCTWRSSVIAVGAALQGVWSVSFQPFILALTHWQQLHLREHLSLHHPSMTCSILGHFFTQQTCNVINVLAYVCDIHPCSHSWSTGKQQMMSQTHAPSHHHHQHHTGDLSAVILRNTWYCHHTQNFEMTCILKSMNDFRLLPQCSYSPHSCGWYTAYGGCYLPISGQPIHPKS